MNRILLIEDDENLGFVIQDQLKASGFDVKWVKDGTLAIRAFEAYRPALCLFDVMLPGKDGFDLAETIRLKNRQTPILFLTARDMVEDRIRGFKSGGDDYITKPFSMEELILRIRVFLNRTNDRNSYEKNTHIIYQHGNLSIDFENHSMTIHSVSRDLTEKETMIFKLLIMGKERILKREEILTKIWGDDDYFMGRSLDVFISKLRKYLKGSSAEIKTYHGVGFKWHESPLSE